MTHHGRMELRKTIGASHYWALYNYVCDGARLFANMLQFFDCGLQFADLSDDLCLLVCL